MCELWPFDSFSVSDANTILPVVVELAKYIYLTTFAERAGEATCFFHYHNFSCPKNKQF